MVKTQLLEHIGLLERRANRISKRIEEYEDSKQKLSNHGHWSLGYWKGKESEIEDTIDFMNGLVKIIDKQESDDLYKSMSGFSFNKKDYEPIPLAEEIDVELNKYNSINPLVEEV
ncbi:hypothetical protein UT300012_32790 [Paraclostridium bifermentans]